MMRIVIYTCTTLLLLHFILYYWNIDPFKHFKKKKIVLQEVKDDLQTCINELKTLDETIENGRTDTELSEDTTPLL